MPEGETPAVGRVQLAHPVVEDGIFMRSRTTGHMVGFTPAFLAHIEKRIEEIVRRVLDEREEGSPP